MTNVLEIVGLAVIGYLVFLLGAMAASVASENRRKADNRQLPLYGERREREMAHTP